MRAHRHVNKSLMAAITLSGFIGQNATGVCKRGRHTVRQPGGGGAQPYRVGPMGVSKCEQPVAHLVSGMRLIPLTDGVYDVGGLSSSATSSAVIPT